MEVQLDSLVRYRFQDSRKKIVFRVTQIDHDNGRAFLRGQNKHGAWVSGWFDLDMLYTPRIHNPKRKAKQ